MSLDINPDVIEFGDVYLPDQCNVKLTNNKTGEVQYRFRLQNSCLTLTNPKGTLKPGKEISVQVSYDPEKHDNKQALLAMQLKTTEIIDGKTQPEQSTIISVKFTEDLDDMFMSPQASKVDQTPTTKQKKWWAK